MLMPPEKIKGSGHQDKKNDPAKSAAAAFFAAGMKRLKIGLVRHEMKFQVSGYKIQAIHSHPHRHPRPRIFEDENEDDEDFEDSTLHQHFVVSACNLVHERRRRDGFAVKN